MKTLTCVMLLLSMGHVLAQEYTEELKDCNYEKDEVFIDWEDETNRVYAEKDRVKKFSEKKLRSFYCQNLVAKDKLETEGIVVSKGGFRLSDDSKNFLIFSVKMGNTAYQDKLYIYIGPRQKLASRKN